MTFRSSWERFALATLFVASLNSAFVEAEDAKPKSETVADSLTPNVGSVVTGSSLIGQTLHDEADVSVGEISDIVIDPYFARVVSLVVKPKQKLERGRRLLVPIELVAKTKKTIKLNVAAEEVESDSTSLTDDGSKPYTRRLSVALYRHYDIKPYWVKDKNEAQVGETPADRDDRFFMLSKLRETSVRSPTDQKLGQIDDVVVSKKDGKIRYVLFGHDHDKGGEKTERRQFAIPLAAFVVAGKTSDWRIELPETLLDNTKIVGEELTQEVSRAWVEYIHVRYGGGVFDGVQRKSKSSK